MENITKLETLYKRDTTGKIAFGKLNMDTQVILLVQELLAVHKMVKKLLVNGIK